MKKINSPETEGPLPEMESLVRLAVSQGCGYGAQDGDIEALDLKGKREVYISRSEAARFIANCQGWSEIAFTYGDGTCVEKAKHFEQGYGVVLTISSTDWESWLSGYELAEDLPTSLPACLNKR